MTLKDNFFTIVTNHAADGVAEFLIKLNYKHFIYVAHFPGKPVTPGVCLVQIAIELIEEYTGKTFRLIEAKNMKFISILSPLEDDVVSYTFNRIETVEDTLRTQVIVHNEKGVFAKMSLILKTK